MLSLIFNIGLELIHLICVIILISYFFIRTAVFSRVVHGMGTIRDKVIIILLFGAFSIYGNVSNIWLNGSQANVRDLGPVIAGLMFGPMIGIGTAIIGAGFRLSQGGITVVPCTLTTIIAGILAGVVWKLNKGRYIGTMRAVLFIIIIELIHLILIILMAGSGPEVMDIIETMWLIMFPLYIIGISVFSIVYANYLTEQKNQEELVRRQVELKSATEIQKSFLPHSPPKVSGYDIHACTYPAREVGGDFYDYISMDDGTVGLVIADVSGKSVPAAIFMALSCTTVRVSSRWAGRPHQAVEQVNSLINRYAESGMFFSLFYAVINPDNGLISYVNAGHPRPVLFRSDGTVEELPLTGPIVGFMDEQVYTDEEISLEDGDLLVCYTDGVTEATRSDGTMLGKTRLYETIAKVKSETVYVISDTIIDEIFRFTGEADQFDDISLLIVKKGTRS